MTCNGVLIMRLMEKIKTWLNLHGVLGALVDKYLHKFLVKLTTIDELSSNRKIIIPIAATKIATPEVKHMNFFHRAKHLQQETYSQPDIYTIVLDNVMYSPIYNALLTKSRKVIADAINTNKTAKRFSVSNLYRRKIEKIPGIYSIFRSTDNSYYHTLIENVPRLYLLDGEEYRDFPEIKLLFSSQPTKIEKYYLDKLLPENFKITVVKEEYIYLVENLIFPTFMNRRFSGYLPLEYLEYFRKKILPQRPRNKVNRIFISRSTDRSKLIEKTLGIGRDEQQRIGRGRYILNEEEVFDVLKKYGFKKYVLEELSIPDQILLFYDADCVVAAHGAGLSNIIFSHQIKILELFPTQFIVPHYYYLSKSLGHTYAYWCGQEDAIHSNFRVNVSDISDSIAHQEQ